VKVEPPNPMSARYCAGRRCSNCEEALDPTDPSWRWNGQTWQHQCGDPQSGVFDAEPMPGFARAGEA
jgi:hypothetical protein